MSKLNSFCGNRKILEILKKPFVHIHFVGVCGIGMYSLFLLSESFGYSVSGSERESSPLFCKLLNEGKKVNLGHTKKDFSDTSLLVYSLAVSDDNPEILAAEMDGVLTVSRADYLGALMSGYKFGIGVSGTHGKSTTTAMLSNIFTDSGKNPTSLLGAFHPDTKSPLRQGDKEYFIYESCEYKDSFLCLRPKFSVFTNLELDHIDYFKDVNELEKSFLTAMNIPKTAFINRDDERLRRLSALSKSKIISFGFSNGSDYRACDIKNKAGFYSFRVMHNDDISNEISLSVPGKFNISNALCAYAVAVELGLRPSDAVKSLSGFYGIERRLEKIGNCGALSVYYDYAHHPTEIECAISALREMYNGEITVIFKPHTYSRTAGLMKEFASALSKADKAVLLDISAIREEPIENVTSERLCEMIGKSAIYIKEEKIEKLICDLETGKKRGALVIMGAANMDFIKKQITEKRKDIIENG